MLMMQEFERLLPNIRSLDSTLQVPVMKEIQSGNAVGLE